MYSKQNQSYVMLTVSAGIDSSFSRNRLATQYMKVEMLRSTKTWRTATRKFVCPGQLAQSPVCGLSAKTALHSHTFTLSGAQGSCTFDHVH